VSEEHPGGPESGKLAGPAPAADTALKRQILTSLRAQEPGTQEHLLARLSERESYAWSWIRIWEQVTINLLSAIILALGGAVGLHVFQSLADVVIVPGQWLDLIIYAALGVALLVGILALLAYLFMRRHPLAALLTLMSLLIGMGAGNGWLTSLARAGQAAKQAGKDTPK
jgi:hypothetical protein